MARRRQPFSWKRLFKKTGRMIRGRRFAAYYCLGAAGALLVTTLYWSLIGASIQSSNADQLANTFLLENKQALAGATFPSQHTFLLKVPLFWLIGLFGSEPQLFMIATVLLSLLTVGGLAFIMWRIERRPLILGTLLFALSAVLLFIPAQSYPGSLLPANFAMLTTRNIEYLFFIGALISFIKAQRYKSVYFIAGCLAMLLLLASDKLFVSLGIATTVLSGLLFAVMRRRDLLRIALRVLVGVIVGYLGAAFTLFMLSQSGLHFDTGSAVGPYGFVQGPKNFVIAIIYAVLGVLTNLGANPAYDATAVNTIPSHLLGGLISPAGPGYVATIFLALLILKATVTATIAALRPLRPRQKPPLDWQVVLPVMLIATAVGALIVFVLSNHYYPADSRYLVIVLFTGFIALAAAYKKARIAPSRLVGLGVILVFAIIFGMIFQLQNLHAQNQAMGEIEHRNSIVAAALKNHPVTTLLGNYWRVLPIKLGSPTLTVTPLQQCTTPRQVLNTTAWQPNLHTTSFAYILRLDGSLADFPDCTLQQITDTYGRPDSSLVVAGTRAQPKELLLFFDEGIHFLKAASPNNKASDTVTPISIDTMPFTTCPTTTIMQVVAHEDDDILFLNPDLTHDIKAGNCIRTVYVTAGDAGNSQLYWLGRQHGAEAAYDTLLGTPGIPWTERVVALDADHTITVANPRGNHNVSLIFLHLPDGNLQGTGFASNRFESLRKLYTRSISAVRAVDDREISYTYGDLTSALTHLMLVYKPDQVRTQSAYSGSGVKDHSDHNTVGEFTTLAFGPYQQAHTDATLTYYLGYPVRDLPINVTGEDYDQKVAAFLSFGQFDAATCHSLAACNNSATYGLYLGRQYTYPY